MKTSTNGHGLSPGHANSSIRRTRRCSSMRWSRCSRVSRRAAGPFVNATRERLRPKELLPQPFALLHVYATVHNTRAGDIPLGQRGILAESAAPAIGLVGSEGAPPDVAAAARLASIAYFGPDLDD